MGHFHVLLSAGLIVWMLSWEIPILIPNLLGTCGTCGYLFYTSPLRLYWVRRKPAAGILHSNLISYNSYWQGTQRSLASPWIVPVGKTPRKINRILLHNLQWCVGFPKFMKFTFGYFAYSFETNANSKMGLGPYIAVWNIQIILWPVASTYCSWTLWTQLCWPHKSWPLLLQIYLLSTLLLQIYLLSTYDAFSKSFSSLTWNCKLSAVITTGVSLLLTSLK